MVQLKRMPAVILAILAGLGAAAQAQDAAEGVYIAPVDVRGAATSAEGSRITQRIEEVIRSQSGTHVVDFRTEAAYTVEADLDRQENGTYRLLVEKIRAGKVEESTTLTADHLGELTARVQGVISDMVSAGVRSGGVASGSQARLTSSPGSGSASGEPTGRSARATEGLDVEEPDVSTGDAFVTAGIMQLSDNLVESDSLKLGLSGGYEWNFGPNGIKAFGDLVFKGDSPGLFGFGLGATHYFDRRSFAPFAGGEIGYGFALPQGPADTEGAFLIGAVGGLQLIRTAGLDLHIGARMSLMTAEVNDDVPFVYGLRLGAYF